MRTYKYSEFIKEDFEELGFVEENEEELDTIDELGDAEDLDIDTDVDTDVDTDIETEEPVDDTTIDDTTIGTIDVSSYTVEEVKTKMQYVFNSIKSINSLVVNAESVALDDATKEKIIKLYNVIQGID